MAEVMLKEALYWTKDDESGFVSCLLCPHSCRIAEGKAGLCMARRNVKGRLYAEGYGRISSCRVDPVEKKPLYHFYPGTEIFSIGGWGCNFRCSFCQNWSISQEFIPGSGELDDPQRVVEAAQAAGAPSIAYTYNEPLINIEFVLDCVRMARGRGLKNVVVTNGYICQEAGRDIIDLADAFNVDIKSIDDGFYKRNCGGHLAPVLAFCSEIMKAGKHLEITNLVIPGENDSEPAVEALAEWIAENLGRHVPLHLSAYRPMYKMKCPETPLSIMLCAYEAASRHLKYVYTGNIMMEAGACTLCPECRSIVIKRSGYSTMAAVKDGNRCGSCGYKLAGFVWPDHL